MPVQVPVVGSTFIQGEGGIGSWKFSKVSWLDKWQRLFDCCW